MQQLLPQCETDIDYPEEEDSLLAIPPGDPAARIYGMLTAAQRAPAQPPQPLVAAAAASAHPVNHSNYSVVTHYTSRGISHQQQHQHQLVRRMTSDSDESAKHHQLQQERKDRRASATNAPRMQTLSEAIPLLPTASSYARNNAVSTQDRRRSFGRRAQTSAIDELLDLAETDAHTGFGGGGGFVPKFQRPCAAQLETIESDAAESTNCGGEMGGAATSSVAPIVRAPPVQRQRTTDDTQLAKRPSIRITITPSSVHEMHTLAMDDTMASSSVSVGDGVGDGNGRGLGGGAATSDKTRSQPDITRPQGQLLEPRTYSYSKQRIHARSRAQQLERSKSVAHNDGRRGSPSWRLNKQKSLNESDIVMALDPATAAAGEASQSAKGPASFRVHWGRRISNMLGHGWTSLSGSGIVSGGGAGAGAGAAGGLQQENAVALPALGVPGVGEVLGEEQSTQTEDDPVPQLPAGLRDQIFSFFQATDNKLSLKLYGNRGAVLREKARQQLVGHFIIHPCSSFRYAAHRSRAIFIHSVCVCCVTQVK